MCLASRPLWMTGVGHDLADIPGGVPPLAAVLVNPMVHVPADKTARVFRTLGAGRCCGMTRQPTRRPCWPTASALLDFMRAVGNDLEEAATAVVPEIRQVLAALTSEPGVEYAALSGAGPDMLRRFSERRGRRSARATGWRRLIPTGGSRRSRSVECRFREAAALVRA